MINTELYINGKLADTSGDTGVRLNRQLINPAELNTKDAQYSYSISLPPSAINHAIFYFANIEETKDKFNRLYTAELIVNSVRIFQGNFRLSNVTAKGYKGNLYIPAAKTIKDIFGELKLNQNPEYRIPFEDFATYINLYNGLAEVEPQAAIFPYVLYGVLPKVPLNKNANTYSARNLWDASVRLGMQDLAPSINPLIMLRHIFNAQGYTLGGSAFDDERIAQLYMSYKNADDYVQPWNYGQHAKIQINGGWSTRYNYRTGGEQLERAINQGNDATGATYGIDLFDAANTSLTVVEDSGGNVLRKEVNDGSGMTYLNAQIRIPTSGFYKIKFNASLHVFDWENWRTTDPATGVQHIGGRTSNANNNFNDNIYEIRLCRDKGSADFGLSGPRLNGLFYYNNQPQNGTFDGNNIPKYFPQVGDGQINFIDQAQDKAHLLGFNFGRHTPVNVAPFPQINIQPANPDFYNPKAGLDPNAQVLVAKPALSWDTSETTDKVTRLAIDAPGYWKYGRIGNFDNEGDNPNIDLDYSGGPFVNGKVLDDNGNPEDPSGGNLTSRISGYFINLITGFQSPNPDWEVSDFIELASYNNLAFSSEVEDGENVAITAFYDINLQYIGFGIQGPAPADPPVTYTNEPVNPPADAAYVRLSGLIAEPMDITADSAADGNIILNRFQLARFYTYLIETDPADNYTGYAYIHNGATLAPLSVVEFINGVAEFNTAYAPLITVDPKLTLYLKTANYDVNGTLTISRRIEGGSEDVIDWELTNKYKIELDNAPANYARCGQYNNGAQDGNWYAQGEANAVVWLEAGELLTIASVSSEGRYRRDGMHSTYGLTAHEILYDLSIQPFRVDADWLKVSLSGNGTAVMDWNDPVNFDTDSINLVGFLSADVKTDDFIDNFCKAFNLRLSQLDATTFALDVKQSKTAVSSQYINLDNIATVSDRSNAPLGLPSLYKLGFTVDPEEEGYVVSGDDGGGQYETGATEENIVEQKSNFSYNWFKDITKVEAGDDPVLPIPIISKADVWALTMPYPEAMRKRYTDLATRFWYFDGLLNDLGAVFSFNGADIHIAKVSNEIQALSILNYKNRRFTILDNFFTVLINGSSHYTEVEAYLTPAMYDQLNGSIMAMFNGDLYYVAELSGYDPAAKNKTKIKLIRKI